MPWAMAIDGSPQGLVDVPLNLLKSGAFNKVGFAESGEIGGIGGGVGVGVTLA